MKTPSTIIAIVLAWSYLLIFFSCSNVQIEKPHWINPGDTLDVPVVHLEFESNHKNWNATLFSFVQPIPLNLKHTEHGFTLAQDNTSGFIEGPGILQLTSGNQQFTYDVYLKNKNLVEIETNDYRSPKTVNPDSSLSHQKILFAIDTYLNLSPAFQSNNYFVEEQISLPPTAGIYVAQKDDPLTSFYVQPGTCTNIPITSDYNTKNQVYNISSGPLFDLHNNIVADGTLVTFIYEDDQFTYREEAHLLNGYAHIQISTDSSKVFKLMAQVDKIQSQEIILSL